MGPLRSVSSLTIWDPAPSSQFLRLLYGGLFRPVSSHTMWGPPRSVFFAYYMGASLRSVSLLIIYGAPSDQLLRTLYGGPSDQFLRLLCGGPLDIYIYKLLRKLYGAPLRSVSSLTIRGSLRSVSLHTIWGPPHIYFFAYYMGAP